MVWMIFTLCLSCFQSQSPVTCAEHQGPVLSDRSGQHDPCSIPGGSLPETGHGQLRCHPSPNICTGRLAVLCLFGCGIDAWLCKNIYLSQSYECFLMFSLIHTPCRDFCTFFLVLFLSRLSLLNRYCWVVLPYGDPGVCARGPGGRWGEFYFPMKCDEDQ